MAAQYINGTMCVIVGDEGTVLSTLDNGLSWQVQTNAGHVRAQLNAVSFANDIVGCTVGDSGTIIKSTTGGISWAQKYSGTAVALKGVDMIDVPTIVVVGDGGAILESIDGGETWSDHSIEASAMLRGVAFANHLVGIVIGEKGLLMRTTDAGMTWTKLSVTTDNLTAIDFLDSTSAVVVGGTDQDPYTRLTYGTILRSSDTGVSWSVQRLLPSGRLRCVSFADRFVGFAGGEQNLGNERILKTTDGGITWSSIPDLVVSPVGAAFSDSNTGVLVGGNSILATTDGGNSWQGRSKNSVSMPLSAVSFSTPLRGYSVGGNDGVNALAAATSDGGTTWTQRACGYTDNNILTSVCAVNENTAFAAGFYPWVFFKTTNGGLNWSPLYTYVSAYWYGISFCDTNIGTAVGYPGAIIRTTDGGATWTQQVSGTTAGLWAVSQLTADIAWVTGSGGLILRTTNGGGVWIQQTSNTSGVVGAISSLDANNAFALSLLEYSDVLLRTSNGGDTWEALPIENATGNFLNNLAATDQHTVIVVGDGGTMLRTTDAGNSWTQLPSGTHDQLSGVSFVNSTVGTVVGGLGTKLRTSNGGAAWIKEEPARTQSPESVLYPNYPNPFNPSTTIKFELPRASHVSLTVYDILGREVSVLVNEKKDAGVHEVRFDGSTLASGVYLYRVTAGSFVQTRKLLLLK